MREIAISTRRSFEIIDITGEINKAVKEECEEKGVSEGVAFVFALHATCALTICESADPGMMHDLENKLKELFPKGAGYEHDRIDGNAHAHLVNSFLKPSLVVPVKNGELLLGTWQAIVLVEADGPRKRRIVVEVIG